MKKILLSLLCLLLAFQANAQAFEPVAVEKNVTVKGQEGTIEFEMYIEQGFHVYSTNIGKGGPMPTTVSFRVVEGAELVGVLTPVDQPIKNLPSFLGNAEPISGCISAPKIHVREVGTVPVASSPRE